MAYDKRATDKRRIQDDDGDLLDITPNGNVTSDTWQEKELDEGEMIVVSCHHDDLAAGSTCTFGFSTCTIHDMHVTISVSTSGKTHIAFHEEPTYTGGTPVAQLNMNRQKTLPCTSAVFVVNPTVTDNGTVLITLHSGTVGWKASIAGSVNMESWILKKNTKYIVIVKNEDSGAIDVSMVVNYHRHD